MPTDTPETTGKKSPAALPKSQTSLRASDVEELGDADLEDDGDDIEELESSLLSDAPPSLRGAFGEPKIVDDLADESDVMDVPSERNVGSLAKPASEAPPTARVAVDTPIPESRGSVQTIPPPADYDTIRRVSTGSQTAFKGAAEASPDGAGASAEGPRLTAKELFAAPGPANEEAAPSDLDRGEPPTNEEEPSKATPPKEDEPAPLVLPQIDPTVFHADAIAVQSSVTPAASMGKSRSRAVAMPRRTSEPRGAAEPERSEPLRAPPLVHEPTEKRAGHARLAVVVAAVLVLGAGLALIGLSSGDERQPPKPRTTATTDVPSTPPVAAAAVTATVAATTTPPEPPPESTPPAATATAPAAPAPPAAAPPTATTTAARTAATPPPQPPAATRATEPASSAKPRGSAPPPGLEFLKPEL